MKISTKPALVLLCCLGCVHVPAAGETAVDAAVAAVHSWYETMGDGSDEEHLKEFRLVGGGVGPLVHAHEQLAAQLKERMDREQFVVHYRGLAHMRLLQAHPVLTTAHDNYVQVFVEEERTMAIEGVPVMAWFEGIIDVEKAQDGWRISSLEHVKPEDIIDALGSHAQLHDDPTEVAMEHLQCNGEECSVIKKAFPLNSAERLGRVTIQTPHGINTVSLARLHDGQWLAIDTAAESAAASK